MDETSRTYVVTGAASGIGAAVTALLREQGHRVVTVDLRDADVVADLSTPAGRADAVAGVQAVADEIHGLVPCAGVAGLTGVDPALVASVNFFGSVELVARAPAPARGGRRRIRRTPLVELRHLPARLERRRDLRLPARRRGRPPVRPRPRWTR